MKKQLLCAIVLCLAVSAGSFAQDKSVKEKLKTIDGKAQSVEVKTDKGTVTFTGDEAEDILKLLTAKRAKKVIVINDDDFNSDENDDVDGDELDFPSHKFNFFHGKGRDGSIRFDVSDFMDAFGVNKVHKKIVIENRDGNKTVTVTTKENGTEKIELFEGKDADKYLEEHKNDNEKDDAPTKGEKKKIMKIIKEDKDLK